MKNYLNIVGVFLILSGVLFIGCSDDPVGSIGSVSWLDSGKPFNGTFRWGTNGLSPTALFSGSICDEGEFSVDIVGGFSQDPCAVAADEFGLFVNGTIVGEVCKSGNLLSTQHLVTCANGSITDTSQEVIIPEVSTILMYSSLATQDGDMGGRAGIDAICAASNPFPDSRGTARGFISVDATDEIADMPENYFVPNLPIASAGGTLIAINWADLLAGSIHHDLTDAVVIVGSSEWWSGSNSDGTLHANNCNGWTSSDGGDSGHTGSTTTVDTTWMDSADLGCGPGSARLICIAY